jgi:two-component system, LytTR family, sensor kinase
MKGSFIVKWPFLRNYLIITFIISLLCFFLLTYYYSITYSIAFVDSVFSSFSLALILLGLGYVVKFARNNSLTSFSSIRNSLIASVLLVLFWTSLSGHVLYYLFQSQTLYIDFLHESLVLRFIAGIFFACMVYLSFFLDVYQKTVKKSLEVEKDLRMMVQKTQLQALKNQLNPHFIFNSLNSISSLTLHSPDKAREMVVMLSDFLRIALRQDAMQKTTLSQELDYNSLYLKIEKIRFEDKLTWEFQVPEEHLAYQVPVLILQPLFENAVKHGIQQNAGPGNILFSSRINNHCLDLYVQNTLDSKFQKFKGEGVGIENVRNRLALIYDGAANLWINSKPNFFEVHLCIPI